ncbi:MAG: class I SAM-dependent methyltransferase [Alphaproteobacteria bacterium]|nr:class I SAM-dependent methyltransferase [Alphaproteobacteria bacterium]
MGLDVVDLREFYISPLGRMVRRLLREKLATLWPTVRGDVVVALGYATPLLRPWLDKAERLIALMPDGQGVAYWPREGPNMACLADMAHMPLPDESVDRVLLLHALENAPNPEAMLQEVWRILKPSGQMVVIIPNRLGGWADQEETPFGTGRPYSSVQAKSLFKEQGFLVERLTKALVMAPRLSHLCLSFAPGLWRRVEALGGRLPFGGFGGVLIVQASKQVLSPALINPRPWNRRLVLPLPLPTTPIPTVRMGQRG